MFNPSKLLSPLLGSAQPDDLVYDPYLTRSDLEVFETESCPFVAALLLHNFTSIECLCNPSNSKAIYILAKAHSNQLYMVSDDLKKIEKWLSIEYEITLLTKANGYLLIQDEYADFYLV